MNLLIKNIKVAAANAQPLWWAAGMPSPMTIFGFLHALGRQTGAETKYFSYISEDFHFRANRWGINDPWTPQQFRGATYINQNDAARGSFTNALQPTALCDIQFSVIVDFDAANAPSLETVKAFLGRARVGGGRIESFGEVKLFKERQAAEACIKKGFCLVDRSQWVQDKMNRDGIHSLDATVDLLQEKVVVSKKENGEGFEAKPLDKEALLASPIAMKEIMEGLSKKTQLKPANPWLGISCSGYQAVHAPQVAIEGSRDEYPHAYAEPLAGLVQWVSVRAAKTLGGLATWKYENKGQRFCVVGECSALLSKKDWIESWKKAQKKKQLAENSADSISKQEDKEEKEEIKFVFASLPGF